ncbi:MAG TPA: ABC transporter permease [Anaerolineaceae bacterium]
MNFGQQIMEALVSLTSNKLRSGLTILGIVIGVAAVIAMLAVGRGAQNSIDAQIQSMGSNLFFLNSGARNVRNPKPLTLQDAEAMMNPDLAPSVLNVVPTIQGRLEAVYASTSYSTQVIGTTPGYADLRTLSVADGEFISDGTVTNKSAVAVLGKDVVDNLFPGTSDIVGQTIRLGGQPFKVIGVLASKGGSSFGSQDDMIIVPLTTAQLRLLRRNPANRVDQIMVQAVSKETVTKAIEETSQILRDRHKTRVGQDDFTVMNMSEILSAASSITSIFTIFLGGIAGISLLVGGIGIMNIMFVTVTERTREIGLRKALGARKIDILIQFLLESATLSLIGGLIGIVVAWGISTLVGRIAAANNTPITPEIGIDAILMATLFSAAIGLFFGIYPSSRAANLEPVEALRSE